MFNIKNIIYFHTLSKVGSYTKTANMLNISQSNLTHAITKLEQDINIKLINRTTRSFALTEFGTLFSQRCESIVDEVDQLMALVSSYKEKGELNHAFIGVIPPVGRMEFFKHFLALNHIAENINYSFVDGSSLSLIEKVKTATLLAAFSTPSQDELDNALLEHHLVLDDHVVVVLSQQHPLAARNDIGLSELVNENLILPQKDTGAYSIISNAFSQLGIKPKHYTECSQIDIVMDMLASNAGIALFSSSVVNLYRREQVIAIPLTQCINKSIYLSFLRRNRNNALLTPVIERVMR